ncbi:hypothetical protein [Micromonospora fulviviridis]
MAANVLLPGPDVRTAPTTFDDRLADQEAAAVTTVLLGATTPTISG